MKNFSRFPGRLKNISLLKGTKLFHKFLIPARARRLNALFADNFAGCGGLYIFMGFVLSDGQW